MANRTTLRILEDLELLMRVNAPLTDGSPMHKEIIAKIKEIKAGFKYKPIGPQRRSK